MKIANILKRPKPNETVLEVEDELQFHLEMLERKYIQHGMSVAEAKSAALRRFGDLQRVKQQCVAISSRNSLLRRVLKISSILVALTGLLIQILGTDYRVMRVGHVLIMIAIATRLLLYVRGLTPSTLLSVTQEKPLSVVTDTPDDNSKLKEA